MISQSKTHLLQNKIIIFVFLMFAVRVSAQPAPRSPSDQALEKFKAYIPAIEKANRACVGNYEAIVGDINEDSLDDVIVRFVLHPCEGGNLIVGSEAAIYINKNGKIVVIGAFPETPCGSVQKIESGKISVRYYECMPPYLKETGSAYFVYRNGQIVKLSSSR